MTDIETERAHQSICQLVEGFDRTSMRATHTREKGSLPGLEGREAVCDFVKLGLLLFRTSKIIQNFVHSFLDSQFIVTISFLACLVKLYNVQYLVLFVLCYKLIS